jgi:hypothetical protein
MCNKVAKNNFVMHFKTPLQHTLGENGGSHKEIVRWTWPLSMHVNQNTHRVWFENISWRKLFEILLFCCCVGYAIVYLNLTCIKSYQAETPSRHRD